MGARGGCRDRPALYVRNPTDDASIVEYDLKRETPTECAHVVHRVKNQHRSE